MLIAIHFARLGPYHVARLDSAVQAMGPLGWTVVALETAGSDSTYSWDRTDAGAAGFTRKTIFPDQVFENIPSAEIKREFLMHLINSVRPPWQLRVGAQWMRAHVLHGAKKIMPSPS